MIFGDSDRKSTASRKVNRLLKKHPCRASAVHSWADVYVRELVVGSVLDLRLLRNLLDHHHRLLRRYHHGLLCWDEDMLLHHGHLLWHMRRSDIRFFVTSLVARNSEQCNLARHLMVARDCTASIEAKALARVLYQRRVAPLAAFDRLLALDAEAAGARFLRSTAIRPLRVQCAVLATACSHTLAICFRNCSMASHLFTLWRGHGQKEALRVER